MLGNTTKLSQVVSLQVLLRIFTNFCVTRSMSLDDDCQSNKSCSLVRQRAKIKVILVKFQYPVLRLVKKKICPMLSSEV